NLCRAGLVTRWVPSQGFRARYISSSLPRLVLAHSSPGETPAGDDCQKLVQCPQAVFAAYPQERSLCPDPSRTSLSSSPVAALSFWNSLRGAFWRRLLGSRCIRGRASLASSWLAFRSATTWADESPIAGRTARRWACRWSP